MVDLDLKPAPTDSVDALPVGNVALMCVRNDANLSACGFEAWRSPVKGWALEAGTGARTVTVWVMDSKGRVSPASSGGVTIEPKSAVVAKVGDQDFTTTNAVSFLVKSVAKEM